MSDKTYFKTSDGNVFYTANSAQNHARTLKDKIVKEVSTSEAFQPKAPKQAVVQDEDTEQVKKAKAEQERISIEKAKQVIAAKPLNKMNKADLTALAKDLGITVPKEWINAQIVEAISAKLSEQTSENK